MFVVAQISGVLAIILFAISPHQRTKVKVLVFQIISSVFFVIQYLILGAYSGAATSIVSIINNVIFAKYAKKNNKIPFYWLLIYIITNILIGIFAYKDIFSIFPVIISIIYAYGVWQENLRVNRFIILFGAIGWIIYNYAVAAYATSIGNLYELISAIIAIWRLDICKKGYDNNAQINSTPRRS